MNLLKPLVLAVSLGCVGIANAQQISPAEKLLFQSNHLQNVSRPTELVYSYRKQGAAPAGFNDEVKVDIDKVNDNGTAVVSTQFLSDARKINIPPQEEAQGNPALLGFLERDIAEMKKLTGGSTSYFRKRIRLALAESAKVATIRIPYQGKTVEGQEVSIKPYENDPMHEKFEKYVGKGYRFVISKDIPGGLYEIQTSLTGNDTSGNVKVSATAQPDETLTLVKADALPGKKR